MDVFWQIVQGIGSIVGLLTGAYVLAERWTKEHPTAFIITKPLSEHGPIRPYVRFENRSSRPLLVAIPNGITPGRFRMSLSHSIGSLITANLKGRVVAPLAGNEQVDFPLLNPPDYDEIAFDNLVEIDIEWMFAQPIIWRAWRRTTISIAKGNLDALVQGRPPDND